MTSPNPIVFWTLTAAFMLGLFLMGWLGEKLSKNASIRRFCNTTLGMCSGLGLAFVGFLAALAGTVSDRLGLMAFGLLFFTFCISTGIFSEETRTARKAR